MGMDWSQCDEVESVPGKMSGAWVIKGTRIPAQGVIDNADDGYSAEQIATEIYEGLPIESARRVIDFAKRMREAAPS
ncbi:MAG: DUF433 domain-containing protein [Chloroflexi bacterium]|nr:DUF433 domain-containing protein [Chloroflexota bacterium]